MTSTAGGEAIVFGGRIRARSGNGIVGAKIEILSRKTRVVLASSISIQAGSYRVRLFRGSIDSQERVLTIRALSGNGKLLVSRSMPVLANETVTDLVVPSERLKDFRPAAQFLPRLRGSILDPESLASIDSAIRLIIPEGKIGHERLRLLSRRAVPPLARFESVLQDSWDVLDGGLDASQRLRRALTFLADAGRAASDRISAPPSAQTGEFALRELAFRAWPSTPLRNIDEMPFRPDICPAPTNRLVPIMAATLRIATDTTDAAMLLDGLDTGLRGLNSFEFLTKLSQSVLSSGNTAPLADELKRLGAAFEVDGDSRLDNGFGGPFPPPGPTPPQPLEPCGRFARECFGNLVEDWRLQAGIRGSSLAPSYSITSIALSDACPGETVVIAGIGFGGIPGQVVFPHQDGVSTIAVDPVVGTWTNTSISAVVPAEAGSGIVRLLIQDGLVWTCEGPLAVFRQGTGGAFVGGIPFVSSVTINGRNRGAIVAPDSQFTVAWKASPSSQQVSVAISEGQPNNVLPRNLLWNQFMPATGTITLRTSPRPSRGELRAQIWAPYSQRCGGPSIVEAIADIDIPAVLKIEGIEVTQGIQIFSLGGARNTLKTVAEKDTIVRVYVSADTGSSFAASPITGVTGSMSVDGIPLYPINGITPDNPSGGNPFITARAAADIDRRQTNHTLNFRIPAALAKGTKTLTVFVWRPGPPTTTLSTSAAMPWQWEQVPPLAVRFVRVLDNTPTGGGTIPTEAQVRYTLQRALELLPTPAKNIAAAWFETFILAGVALPGSGGDMGRLVTALRFLRALPDPATETEDHSGWIGLTSGVLSSPIPMSLGTTVSQVSTTPIYTNQDHQGPFRILAAHEISHWLAGSCHTDNTTPCPGTPGPNPTGEVVFDPFWNEAVAPTFSYFNRLPTPPSWLRPREWDLRMVDIIAWEGRP